MSHGFKINFSICITFSKSIKGNIEILSAHKRLDANIASHAFNNKDKSYQTSFVIQCHSFMSQNLNDPFAIQVFAYLPATTLKLTKVNYWSYKLKASITTLIRVQI